MANKPLTPIEFAAEMQKIADELKYENEVMHLRADHLISELLRNLGYDMGIKIYDGLDLWYA